MGHTVWSQRIVVDLTINELMHYGKALRQEDRIIYEQMLKVPLKHVNVIAYANSMHAWALMLLSIMLEQEKRIRQLEKKHAEEKEPIRMEQLH